MRLHKSVSGILLMLFTLSASAQDQRLRKVETVLDRLEKYLLDHHSDVLSFDEVEKDSQKSEKGVVTKYQFNESKIGGSTPSEKKLKEIKSAIDELAAEVDLFAADVQKSKQALITQSRVDNHIEIEAELEQADRASIRHMSMKLDGFDLYKIDEESGVWLPQGRYSIFAGPMSPGNHRVDVEIQIALSHQVGLKANDSIYRLVQKSFKIEIPDGKFNRKWVIKVSPPASADGQAQARLEVM